MRVPRILAYTVALLGIFALTSPSEAQQCPKGKLRLYTSWPMQGAMLPEGTGMKNGVDLAVAEAGGAVAGFCLEVVNLDDASPQTGKWDGAVEAENANKAVGDPLAIVYIGTYNSGAAKVSIPITNRAHMAQVTPANTYPGLTKKRGAAPGEPDIYRPGGFVNYFRPIPADDIQGAVAAKWAKRLGTKKVFILNDQELYGKGIADVFEATAKKIGLAVVANEGIDWKQPDQKPILTKIRASGADLVYMGGVIETGAQVVIRQMKEVGLTAPRTRFMGPDGLLEEELLKGATCDAALATEMRITFAGLPFEKMRGVGAKTYETYKAKYGKEPTSYALYAAEGTRVIIDAIKRAAPAIEKGKDPTEKREALRKAIASTKNYEGINGKWSFDENGDVDYDTMSGFKAVKADGPIGCKFQFETILE
ncbi:MAG TPA: branched-chain amino acid ABC transporter substrate-binding protein [Candidatus Nitrosocosmicus sp.]|jgi:branched-chain amino acid transport system substrate-binding protein|nr:branched-chain amino acid ABC transporter substrate-binding protein [Candidatus Nitrosocosmicus sp.]